jgi:hypothetical protein
MAINHTSEKQLEGWEELIEAAYQIYKMSPRCQTADDARDFWLKVTGWHSDHAEDQKKLFRLVAAMKTRLERERRGERSIAQMAPAQWVEILFKVSQAAVTAAGGISAWERLGDEERLACHNAALTDFVRTIGQEEFDMQFRSVRELMRQLEQKIAPLVVPSRLQVLLAQFFGTKTASAGSRTPYATSGTTRLASISASPTPAILAFSLTLPPTRLLLCTWSCFFNSWFMCGRIKHPVL